jgi:YfiH family protein
MRTWALADGRTASVAWTDRRHGDLAVDGDREALARRRAAIVDVPWTWLRQVHGAAVATVDRPGAAAGVEADAAVTATTSAAVAAHTADCVPIGLVAVDGDPAAVGVVHAGWRGLAAGVVVEAARALRDLAGGSVEAVIGPCIHAECYEFGAADLADVVGRLGPRVAATTPTGAPALDLPAAAELALHEAGVGPVWPVSLCTSCDPSRYSHRARGDRGRNALVAWIDP